MNHSIGIACPAPTGSKPSFTKPANGAAADEPDVIVLKNPWLMNRSLDGI